VEKDADIGKSKEEVLRGRGYPSPRKEEREMEKGSVSIEVESKPGDLSVELFFVRYVSLTQEGGVLL